MRALRTVLVACALTLLLAVPSVIPVTAQQERAPTVPFPEAGAAYYYEVAFTDENGTHESERLVRFLGIEEVLRRDGVPRLALVWDLVYPDIDSPDGRQGMAALLSDPHAGHSLTYVDVATFDRLETRGTGGGNLTSSVPYLPLERTWTNARSWRYWLDAGLRDPDSSLWGATLGTDSLTLATIDRGFVGASWGRTWFYGRELLARGASHHEGPGFPHTGGEEEWRLDRVDEIEGQQAWWYRIEEPLENHRHGRKGVAVREMALSAAAPLPLATRTEYLPEEGGGRAHTAVLTDWRPGVAAIPWGQEAVGEPAPPPQTTPSSPWGPADGGSGLAYPLDLAIASIRGDPSLVHFQLMALQGQPVLVNAWYEVRPGGRMHTPLHEARWALVFEDAKGNRVNVESKLLLDLPEAAAKPLNRDGPGGEKQPTVDVVRPEDLPPALPTVRSAVEAWRTYGTEPDREVDAAVYSVGRNPDGSVHAYVGVGWQEEGTDGVPPRPALGPEQRYHLLVVDPQGLPVKASATASITTTALAPLGSGQAGSGSEDRAGTSDAAHLPMAPLAVAGVALTAAGGAAAKLLMPAYHRLDRRRVLENPLRRALLELVERSPGLHFNEAQRELGVGVSTLSHHVASLERAGLVRSHRGGGFRRLYPSKADARVSHADAATRHARSQALLRIVEARPGIGLREAARELGVPVSSLHWHVDKLVEARLLERRPQGLFPGEGSP